MPSSWTHHWADPPSRHYIVTSWCHVMDARGHSVFTLTKCTCSLCRKEDGEVLKQVQKSVRFDDVLDDLAPGQMGPLRRNLKMEDQHTRRRLHVRDGSAF